MHAIACGCDTHKNVLTLARLWTWVSIESIFTWLTIHFKVTATRQAQSNMQHKNCITPHQIIQEGHIFLLGTIFPTIAPHFHNHKSIVTKTDCMCVIKNKRKRKITLSPVLSSPLCFRPQPDVCHIIVVICSVGSPYIYFSQSTNTTTSVYINIHHSSQNERQIFHTYVQKNPHSYKAQGSLSIVGDVSWAQTKRGYVT